jgi:hypothetical protein
LELTRYELFHLPELATGRQEQGFSTAPHFPYFGLATAPDKGDNRGIVNSEW